MHRYARWMIALSLMTGGVTTAGADEYDEPVRNLTIIAAPGWGDREVTERRFRFILTSFVQRCADVETAVQAADRLAFVYGKIDEAGLSGQEGLLAMSNTVHYMTSEISNAASRANLPLKCSEIWAMYIVVRQQGMSPEEARRGVSGVARTLYGLAQ